MESTPYTKSIGTFTWLVLVLGLLIAADAAAFVIDVADYRVLHFLVWNPGPHQALWKDWVFFHELQPPYRDWGMVAVSAALSVLLLVWIYRVVKNLRSFDLSGLRYSPVWSVLWWFIPLANTVMPVLVLREVYKASRPGRAGEAWKRSSAFMVVLWWLVVMAACTAYARLLVIELETGRTLGDAYDLRPYMIVSDAAAIVANALLLYLVVRVHRWQGRRAEAEGLLESNNER